VAGLLFAGGAVDGFAQEVRVAVVACVLFEHVTVDPTQRQVPDLRGTPHQTVTRAEAVWIRSVIDDLRSGRLRWSADGFAGYDGPVSSD
jgi:hypothetical protein